MAIQAPPRPPLGQLGTTGLNQWNGHVNTELLPELEGQQWWRVLRQMTEQHPVMVGILLAIEMLIRQARWFVEPYSDAPRHRADARFVEQCLFEDMSLSWADTLSECISFLAWGWAYMEIVWKRRLGQQNDPAMRSRFDDGRTGIRKLNICAQDTLLKWDFDPDGGIRAMIQQAAPDWRERTIPIEKALLFRTTSRRGNPEGVSIFRGAYRAWYFQTRIENIEGIGVERDLAGFPVIEAPEEIVTGTAPEAVKVREQLLGMLSGVKRDEYEGALVPSKRDRDGNPMYAFRLITSGGNRQFDTNLIINRYSAQIAMSVMADFLVLGHERVGSYALARTKSDLFGTALSAWLDGICDTIDDHLIDRLYMYNGMDRREPCRLRHGDVRAVDIGALGTFVKNLADSGAPLFANPELLNHILERADLPVAIPGLSSRDTGTGAASPPGGVLPPQAPPAAPPTAGDAGPAVGRRGLLAPIRRAVEALKGNAA